MVSTTDAMFIDYQMSFWASPSSDFLYFLVTSVNDDLKTKHFDEFLQFYYDELVTSLKKLSHDLLIPTSDEFYDDMLEKAPFGKYLKK